MTKALRRGDMSAYFRLYGRSKRESDKLAYVILKKTQNEMFGVFLITFVNT